jgi:dTDP-4-dehydrorhamnose reductase
MIMLLGASGYVGSAIRDHLVAAGVPHRALSLQSPQRDPRDILREAIRQARPEFLISAAGFTGKPNVDASEDQKALCVEANVTLPAKIGEVCTTEKISWGHVSSGCIYTGSRPDGSGFTEEDPPNFDFRHNNCSFYSGTKALAEEVLRDLPNLYLWRLRIPFSHIDNPRNYLSKLMRYAHLVDVRNSISNLEDFARITVESWTQRIPFGTYNVTNPGSVTTREVVDLLQQAGLGPRSYKFFESVDSFHRLATRTPRANCVMDSSKLIRAGIRLPTVEESLKQCLRRWQPAS